MAQAKSKQPAPQAQARQRKADQALGSLMNAKVVRPAKKGK